jgi:GNAT superfamily N-acetyltransferase
VSVRDLLRTVAHWLFGDYRFYHVREVDAAPVPESPPWDGRIGPITNLADLAGAKDHTIRAHGSVNRELGYYAFGAWVGDELASFVILASQKALTLKSVWPLEDGEAMLAQVTTEESFRGRGIAPILINYTARKMGELGFRRLYATIWHSNATPMWVFDKAGWQRFAFLMVVYPFGTKRPGRFVWRRTTRQPPAAQI